MTTAETFDVRNLSLHAIARLIERDWKNVNYAARPYLDAMKTLETVDDSYVADSGASIVRYFLGNAQSYSTRSSRGLVVPADVKNELKRRIKNKY